MMYYSNILFICNTDVPRIEAFFDKSQSASSLHRKCQQQVVSHAHGLRPQRTCVRHGNAVKIDVFDSRTSTGESPFS